MLWHSILSLYYEVVNNPSVYIPLGFIISNCIIHWDEWVPGIREARDTRQFAIQKLVSWATRDFSTSRCLLALLQLGPLHLFPWEERPLATLSPISSLASDVKFIRDFGYCPKEGRISPHFSPRWETFQMLRPFRIRNRTGKKEPFILDTH